MILTSSQWTDTWKDILPLQQASEAWVNRFSMFFNIYDLFVWFQTHFSGNYRISFQKWNSQSFLI